jgi:hypothetical protein
MYFTDPAEPEYLRLAELEDHLIAIEVHEFQPSRETEHGFKPAILATVHDIDRDATYEGALLFASGIVSRLKGLRGRTVLAWLERGTSRNGHAAPWLLRSATTDPSATARAHAYLNGRWGANVDAP